MTDHKVKAAVTITPVSSNAKTGAMAVTYAPQQTCPTSCPLMNAGCYAEHGYVGFATAQRNSLAASLRPLDLAQAEADGIDALPATTALRAHVVGDCATPEAASIVGAAMVRYEARSKRGKVTKQVAWTYTHAWREVPRAAWQGARVLASCQSAAEVLEARALGYAAVLITPPHPTRKAYAYQGVKVIPCPAEGGARTCKDCQLCARGDAWGADAVIGFAAHGARKGKVLRALE